MKEYDVGKMFTFMRGFCAGGEYPETTRALGFMRDKHDGQVRKSSGQPYIVHPLSMACYATGLSRCKDDVLLAAILLHDVPEDTNVPVEQLPCGAEVKKAVKYMTLMMRPGESKVDAKIRYFYELLECRRSAIVKGLDRFDNLSTMQELLFLAPEGDMRMIEKRERAIVKNVFETHALLLPILKEAKERWPEFAGTFHVLRYNLRAINTTLAYAHGINLYSAEYKFCGLEEGVEKYRQIAKDRNF